MPGDPQDPRFDHMLIVQSQGNYCCPTNGRYANDVGASIGPSQMTVPSLNARVEERNKFTRNRIQAVSFRALEFIAAVTGGTEVVQDIAST